MQYCYEIWGKFSKKLWVMLSIISGNSENFLKYFEENFRNILGKLQVALEYILRKLQEIWKLQKTFKSFHENFNVRAYSHRASYYRSAAPQKNARWILWHCICILNGISNAIPSAASASYTKKMHENTHQVWTYQFDSILRQKIRFNL